MTHSAVAIIPARGGSRRVPKKNVRPFFGKPVVAYSIDTAQRSGLFDAVYVSTDDPKIAEVASLHGAEVHVRNPVMAEDAVGTQEVMRNVLLELFQDDQPEFACCIYPCAPTLWASDLVSAKEALDAKDDLQYVMVEGMFYFGRTKAFMENVVLENDRHTAEMEECYRWIDINTISDFQEAARIFLRMQNRHV